MWHSTRAPNLLQKHEPKGGVGGQMKELLVGVGAAVLGAGAMTPNCPEYLPALKTSVQ
jgi:hypothetical protein